MSLARSAILSGPGKVKINATELFTRGDIEVTPGIELAGIDIAHAGIMDQILIDSTMSGSFTPANYITAGILTALYPRLNPTIGSSLLTSADVPIAVIGKESANNKITLHSAGISQMPSLRLSARNPQIFAGPASLFATVKTSTERSAANSMYTIGTEAWTGAVDRSNILTAKYTGTWGDALTISNTADGWQVDFECGWSPIVTDEQGTVDWLLESVTVRARCRPIGVTLANILDSIKLQGASIGDPVRQSDDLTITGTGGLTVVLKDAAMIQGPQQWGKTTLRHGEVGFIAVRSVDGSNNPDAIASVAIAA